MEVRPTEFIAGIGVGVLLMCFLFIPWCWRLQKELDEMGARYFDLLEQAIALFPEISR